MITQDRFSLLFSQNQHSEIISLYNKHILDPNKDPFISRLVAASYFTVGELQEAFEILSAIESCFASDPEYLSLFGACCRRLAKFDHAQKLFKSALALNPTSLTVQNNYANLLIDLDEFDSAESILRSILEKKADYSDAAANLQRLQEKRNHLNSNVVSSGDTTTPDSFKLADPLALAFSDEESKLSLNIINNNNQPKNTKIKELAQALPELKNHQIASDQIDLAFQACKDRRFEFALQLCSEARLTLCHLPSLWECAGDAYIGLQRFLEAEVCLLHALSLGSSGCKIYANLSTLACIKKDFLLSQIYFDKAFGLDPSYPHLTQLRKQIMRGKSMKESELFQFSVSWASPRLSASSK